MPYTLATCRHYLLHAVLSLSLALAPLGGVARAEDSWKPFAEKDAARAKKALVPDPRPVLPAMDGSYGRPAADGSSGGNSNPDGLGPLAPLTGASSKVEREELAPLAGSTPPGLVPPGSTANDSIVPPAAAPIAALRGTVTATGQPLDQAGDMWRGLELARIEQLITKLEIPPRSAAMHALWRRLLLSDAVPTTGGSVPFNAAQFNALRAEGLYRSGLIRDQAELLAKTAVGNEDAVLTAMRARAEISAGRRDTGCEAAKAASVAKEALPKRLRGEVVVMTGYCAAADGNASAAGLAAELAREEGLDAPGTLALLDAVAAGGVGKTKVVLPKRLDALDLRLMQLLGSDSLTPAALERADAAALAAIATDASSDPKIRLAAAEAAARLNAIEPDQLAETYRAIVFSPTDLGEALSSKADPTLRRALLFKAAEVERTQLKKVRVIRALLDDARRIGLYAPMLRALGPSIATLPKVSEIGWFAETAIEISLAGGQYDGARAWVDFAGGVDRPGGAAAQNSNLQHWAALIDIADPQVRTGRGESLSSVEDVALKGRFNVDALHRLATVLDALDTNVPIALWDAANKAPQPAGGHLPETGVLAELQDASKKKEFARTVLLGLRAFGPNAADGAHILALGDTIRALKRTGLATEARGVGFEALFAIWPRSASN